MQSEAPAVVAQAPAEFSCAKTFSFNTNFNSKIVLGLQMPLSEWSPKDTKTLSFETGGEWSLGKWSPKDAKTMSFEMPEDSKWSLKGVFGASALASKTFSFEMP